MGFRGICARRNVFNFTGERFLSAMHTLCVQAISYSSLKSICNWGEGLGWPCCCCCFENIDSETQTLPSCVRISDSSRLIRGISRFTRKLTFMTSRRLRLWEKRSLFDSRSRGRQKICNSNRTSHRACFGIHSKFLRDCLQPTSVRRDFTVALLMLTLIYACL